MCRACCFSKKYYLAIWMVAIAETGMQIFDKISEEYLRKLGTFYVQYGHVPANAILDV